MENDGNKSREQQAIGLLAGIFKPRPQSVEQIAEAETSPAGEQQPQGMATITIPSPVTTENLETAEAMGWTINPADVRAKQSMTQEEFGAALRIPPATIRNWEQQRVLPDPAARALLTMLDANPKAMAILDKAWRPKKAKAKAA